MSQNKYSTENSGHLTLNSTFKALFVLPSFFCLDTKKRSKKKSRLCPLRSKN